MRGGMAWLAWGVMACGEDGEATPEQRVEDILALEPDPSAGAEVFAAQCAGCHGDDGSGAQDGFELVGTDIRGNAEQDVVAAVVDPPSGMFTFETLPDQSVADVAGHVGRL